MAIQQTFILGWAGQNGANPITNTVTVSGEGEDNRSVTVAGNATVDVDLDWTSDRLLGIYVSSTGAYRLILNPNSTTPEEPTPSDTVPMQWIAASGLPYPFDASVVAEIALVSEQDAEQTITIKTIQDSIVS